MGFLDILSDLNRQNFGGGLAVYGKAMRNLKDNQQLVEGINRFKEKKRLFEDEQLKTTDQQLIDFESNKESGKPSLMDKLQNSSLNLVDVYDKIGAYQNLYQPFITAFATLGNDGVKVASTLSQELGQKVSMMEKKGMAPLKEMEFESIKQDYDLKNMQLKEANYNYEKKVEIDKVASYIMSDPLFAEIPGGNITTYRRSDWVNWNAKRNAVLDHVAKHLKETTGKTYTKDELGIAFNKAQIHAGNAFRFIHQPPAPGQPDPWTIYGKTQLMPDIAALEAMTAQLNNLDVGTKQLVKDYMTKPEQAQLPDDPAARERIVSLAKMFLPGGAYMSKWQQVKAYYLLNGIDITKHIPKTIDINGKTEHYSEVMKGLENIIMPYSTDSFITDVYIHNPGTTKRIKNELLARKQDILSGNIFQSGETDDIFTQMFKANRANPFPTSGTVVPFAPQRSTYAQPDSITQSLIDKGVNEINKKLDMLNQ